MKLILKMIVAFGAFVGYYVLFCLVMGMDWEDPWNKLIKWARK